MIQELLWRGVVLASGIGPDWVETRKLGQRDEVVYIAIQISSPQAGRERSFALRGITVSIRIPNGRGPPT